MRRFWDEYKVSTNDLVSVLDKYSLMALENKWVSPRNYDLAMIPTSPTQQKELETRQRLIGVLNFENPILDCLPYDIIWQNLKIQEKPAYKGPHLGFYAKCSRDRGVKYTRNDFDVLLVHCNAPYDRYFYFIPTNILTDRKILKSETCPGKFGFFVYPPGIPRSNVGRMRDEWANSFRYEYKEPNLENKLINICKTYSLLG